MNHHIPPQTEDCQDAGSTCTVLRSDKGKSDNATSCDQPGGFHVVLGQNMSKPTPGELENNWDSCSSVHPPKTW